ncbi:MAG: flagellar biosynthetic protein FliO [Candidatus Hydrogenedentota bacterium]
MKNQRIQRAVLTAGLLMALYGAVAAAQENRLPPPKPLKSPVDIQALVEGRPAPAAQEAAHDGAEDRAETAEAAQTPTTAAPVSRPESDTEPGEKPDEKPEAESNTELEAEPEPDTPVEHADMADGAKTEAEAGSDDGVGPPSSAIAALQSEYTPDDAQQEDTATPRVGMPTTGRLALNALLGLAIVCALIVLGAWALKRFGKGSRLLAGSRYGEVLGRLYLTPKITLHYVRTGGRILVLGVTPQAATLITELDPTDFETPLAAPNPAPDTENAGHQKPAGVAPEFAARLREQVTQLDQPAQDMDDDITALRGDIERLRSHLRENPREPRNL